MPCLPPYNYETAEDRTFKFHCSTVQVRVAFYTHARKYEISAKTGVCEI